MSSAMIFSTSLRFSSSFWPLLPDFWGSHNLRCTSQHPIQMLLSGLLVFYCSHALFSIHDNFGEHFIETQTNFTMVGAPRMRSDGWALSYSVLTFFSPAIVPMNILVARKCFDHYLICQRRIIILALFVSWTIQPMLTYLFF